MDKQALARLARRFLSGEMGPEELSREVSWSSPTGNTDEREMPKSVSRRPASLAIGPVTLDLDRPRRCGFPEVVYAEGKSVEVLREIFPALLSSGVDVLATRVDAAKGAALVETFPRGRYNATARTFRLDRPETAAENKSRVGRVVIVTAGTSDRPAAEEARETLDWMGVETVLLEDIGVAGPLRLLERLGELEGADAVVVVAGMEGALPSVVAGHVACPVVAVPTSIGYGANFGGAAALLSMLNSCAASVSVVNIDAGFKGGFVAGLIARKR